MKKLLIIILVIICQVACRSADGAETTNSISSLADSNLIRTSGFDLRHYIIHLKIIISKERIIPQLIESIDTNYRVNYVDTRSMLNSTYLTHQYFFGCELVQILECIISSDSASYKGYEQIITQYSGLKSGMKENIDNYYSLLADSQLELNKSFQESFQHFKEKLSEQEKDLISCVEKQLRKNYIIRTGFFNDLEYTDLAELKQIYQNWWQAHKNRTIVEIHEDFMRKGSPLSGTKYYQNFHCNNN